MRLAIEYATEFRCPYQLSAAHMRSLETDAERGRALQLETNVNNVIRYTMRRMNPGVAGLGAVHGSTETNPERRIGAHLQM